MFTSRSKVRAPFSPRTRPLLLQTLERRIALTASLGWDGPGLGSAQLTYHIANQPASLSSSETRAAIETALDAWSNVADISFTPTTQPGLNDSLDFSFISIDGAGGTLARAYFPDDVNPARIAGDVQFDLAETWEVGNARGSQAFDLVWVAVHEIGHALGLDHLSNSVGSVLAPTVSPNQVFTKLSPADVDAVLALYAPRATSPTNAVDSPASAGLPGSVGRQESPNLPDLTPRTSDPDSLPERPPTKRPEWSPRSGWYILSGNFWSGGWRQSFKLFSGTTPVIIRWQSPQISIHFWQNF